MDSKITDFLTILLVMFALIFLGGCATQKTVDMAKSYNQAYGKHVTQEAAKVDSKAKAIAKVMTFDCDDGTEACGAAKALSGLVAAREIADIKAAPFTLEKHATDIDAQIAGAKELGKGVPFFTVGVVSVKSKGETKTSTSGGSTSTYINDEDRATSFGDESSPSNYPDNDSSSTESTEVAGAVE